MATSQSNIENANVNVVNKSQTINASEPKGLAYVQVHLSELAGSLEDNQKLLKSNYLKAETAHTQFNGRWLTLRSSVTERVWKELLSSIELKVAARSELAHIEVCEMSDGKAVKRHILLVKQVSVEQSGSDMVHGETKVSSLDSETIKKYLKLSSKAQISLTGYRHSGDSEFVPCTNYDDLLHEVACEQVCMQEYTAEDGTKGKCPIFVKDENGKSKPKTEVKNVSFYPVLNETVSPKAFINTVNKALSSMWLMLFPEKQSETAEAAK